MRASVRRERVIQVPAEDAWAVVSRPDLLHLWFPGIVACTVEGDARTITLGTGMQLAETLLTNDPLQRRFQYRIASGIFAEHLGTGIYEGVWVGPDSTIPNTRGVRNDVVAALKALKVPNVRWPGGCFADEYHWRKGIGPERPATLNPNWGGVIEPNSFGTHEFMDFVEQIGSEAFISVNIGSGTPQEAAPTA